jgi:hypothetical protein
VTALLFGGCLTLAGCLDRCAGSDPAPAAPTWNGGPVSVAHLANGDLATLRIEWRAGVPMHAHPRLPTDARVVLARVSPDGESQWTLELSQGPGATGLALESDSQDRLHVAILADTAEAPQARLVTVSGDGAVLREADLGMPGDVVPLALAVTADGRLRVGGATTTRLYGTYESPGDAETLGLDGFLAEYPSGDPALGGLAAASDPDWVRMWMGAKDQRVTGLDVAPTGDVWWVGDTPGALGVVRAPGDLNPAEELVFGQRALALVTTPDGGAVVAGWAPEAGKVGPVGAVPLHMWVARIGPDLQEVWRAEGCCSTWPFDLDVALDGDHVLVAGRVDGADLQFGPLSEPSAPEYRAWVAVLDAAAGGVLSLHDLGPVDPAALDLPIAVFARTAAAGDGRVCVAPGGPFRCVDP